jgi:hypothetical protein
VEAWDDFDDFNLVPYDNEARFPLPDHSISMIIQMRTLIDGAN